MAMDDRVKREALNQSLFREVNERIEQVFEGFGPDGEWEFLCECGRGDCGKRVTLKPAQYEWVRAHPRRFLVARGHEADEVEQVVARLDGFVVVEAFGIAGSVADETDLRGT